MMRELPIRDVGHRALQRRFLIADSNIVTERDGHYEPALRFANEDVFSYETAVRQWALRSRKPPIEHPSMDVSIHKNTFPNSSRKGSNSYLEQSPLSPVTPLSFSFSILFTNQITRKCLLGFKMQEATLPNIFNVNRFPQVGGLLFDGRTELQRNDHCHSQNSLHLTFGLPGNSLLPQPVNRKPSEIRWDFLDYLWRKAVAALILSCLPELLHISYGEIVLPELKLMPDMVANSVSRVEQAE